MFGEQTTLTLNNTDGLDPHRSRQEELIISFATPLHSEKNTTSSIESFPRCDHKLVKAHVIINNFERGPGFWKFNSSLLSETEFVNEAEKCIDAHFKEYLNGNPVVAWEMCKLKFKSFCLQYSGNQSKK